MCACAYELILGRELGSVDWILGVAKVVYKINLDYDETKFEEPNLRRPDDDWY